MVFIQARMSSARFRGKMLEKIDGLPLVEFVYQRCLKVNCDVVTILTSTDYSDNEMYEYCCDRQIPVHRGPLDNVLKRFVDAGDFYQATHICRVCGDSPFVDTDYIDQMFEMMTDLRQKTPVLDYMTITGCLDGFRSEIVTLSALKRALRTTNRPDYLEHVTKYIVENPLSFKTEFLNSKLTCDGVADVSITVDYPRDMELVNHVIKHGLNGFDFSSNDVLKCIEAVRRVKGYDDSP